MGQRTFRLRHYVGTIVTACALGGLLLAFELAFLFQGIESRDHQVRESGQRLAALETWAQEVTPWLRRAREAVDRADLRASVETRASDLLVTLEKLTDQCRPAFAVEFEGLRLKLDSALEGLRMAPDPTLPGAAVELEGIARAFDGDEEIVGLGEDVARDLEVIRGGLRTELDGNARALESRRDGLWRTVTLSTMGYGLLVLVLWRWLVAGLIRPLQTLTEEARRTHDGERDFGLVPAGPLEVRQLNESLSTLVAGLMRSRETLEEKVLERTLELERANRAKNEFLANMSHEIRTPMTAILGYAELCLAPEVSDQDERRYVEIIHANGEHLLAVINDILDVSKIEAGQMTIEPTVCSPLEIVSEVRSLMEVRASTRGLTLTVEHAGPVPETVRTDPTRLRQILLNLVTNAIKFTEQGGVLIRVGVESPAGGPERLVFEVSDSGVGMTPEELGRVFHPFVQADTSTTRRFGGSGLGLTISRTLARMMGGDLTCTSQAGGGSTFRVEIDPGPLEDVRRIHDGDGAGAAVPARRWSAPAPELSGRVLLAEDVAVNRRLIATLLKRTGLEVDEAENGLLAVEKARAAVALGAPYAILFMDMQMPELDGYAATRALRAEGYGNPIVALTSHSMSGERERCLEAGCDDYMTKPVDRKVLLQVLGRFMKGAEPRARAAG